MSVPFNTKKSHGSVIVLSSRFSIIGSCFVHLIFCRRLARLETATGECPSWQTPLRILSITGDLP
jgi:hypothetical protein